MERLLKNIFNFYESKWFAIDSSLLRKQMFHPWASVEQKTWAYTCHIYLHTSMHRQLRIIHLLLIPSSSFVRLKQMPHAHWCLSQNLLSLIVHGLLFSCWAALCNLVLNIKVTKKINKRHDAVRWFSCLFRHYVCDVMRFCYILHWNKLLLFGKVFNSSTPASTTKS